MRRRIDEAAVVLGALALGLAPAPVRAQGIEPPPGAESAAFQKAVADFAAGRYEACRKGFAEISRAANRAGLGARAAYGAACCAAQGGDADRAFDELSLALANGYSDTARALTDPRLDPLAKDRRWLPLLKQMDQVRRVRQQQLDPTLLALYEELEAERRVATGGGPERAAARRASALDLVDKGRLKQAEDHFHAAAILVESDRADEVGRARALAHRALEIDPDLLAARPIYATALDRELLLAGKPQKFGTQSVRKEGVWTLHDVDPAVTDADRKAWGVPPLAELRSRLSELPAP
jgi:hypothetical protein